MQKPKSRTQISVMLSIIAVRPNRQFLNAVVYQGVRDKKLATQLTAEYESME